MSARRTMNCNAHVFRSRVSTGCNEHPAQFNVAETGGVVQRVGIPPATGNCYAAKSHETGNQTEQEIRSKFPKCMQGKGEYKSVLTSAFSCSNKRHTSTRPRLTA
jgi:hypothetical protein